MFTIPFEPVIGETRINVHLILEYAAFFIAFRYYVYLKRRSGDAIPPGNRLSIILAAAIGALVGSRIMAFLENPVTDLSRENLLILLNAKTIMGGLFGGLLSVELAKRMMKEKQSSGDLFTFPIIVGIIIGRVGCFLTGINEFTYGAPTEFFLGMDLGDGIVRHPLALYEIIFLIMLLIFLRKFKETNPEDGLLFKWFMILYFGFRFIIEFLKPNTFLLLSLSSIQWLCITCFIYYRNTLFRSFKYAYQKIYIL